jgi:uncharacterized membrane protein (DUF106 family)
MKSMRRVYWMAFMTVLAVSLSGCGGLQKQLVDANARIKELNEQIGKFSEAMEKSADKIDPLAIKEIFRKGNDLAKMNQELQRLVETGGPRLATLIWQWTAFEWRSWGTKALFTSWDGSIKRRMGSAL